MRLNCLICLLCILVPMGIASGPSGARASPPQLYFQKTLETDSDKRYAYRIKKGEHVYDILRQMNVPARIRPDVLQQTKKMNPHIEDLDRVKPGQIVYFPSTVKEFAQLSQASMPDLQSPLPTVKYRVRSGEHLAQILRQKVGLSDDLIFSEYTSVFRKLNPGLQDIDLLQPGQVVTLPLPPGESTAKVSASRPSPEKKQAEQTLTSKSGTAGQPFASETSTQKSKDKKESQQGPQEYALEKEKEDREEKGGASGAASATQKESGNGSQSSSTGQAVAKTPGEPEGEKEAGANKTRTAKSEVAKPDKAEVSAREETNEESPSREGEQPDSGGDKELVLGMLREMGLGLSAEEEILYPAPGGGWVHLDLDRTPMLQTPWGQSILILPQDQDHELSRKKAEQSELTPCPVKNWSPSQVFTSLEEASGRRFVAFGSGQSLILNYPGLILELRGSYQFAIKGSSPTRYHVFFRDLRPKSSKASLLAGFLRKKNIRIHSMEETDVAPQMISPDTQPEGSLHTPRFSFKNLWPAVERTLSAQGKTAETPINRSPSSLLTYLKQQDLASSQEFRLPVLEPGDAGSIAAITLDAVRIELQEPAFAIRKETVDPYLFALLGLQGYDCYILSP